MNPPNTLGKHILNDFQRDFPLVSRPYAAMAEALGVHEGDVLDALGELCENGAISRVGAVLKPGTVGASTLCAMAVDEDRLEEVAGIVSGFEAVNHNYEREHRLNLWFVVTAADDETLKTVLDDIRTATGHELINLPMVEGYHLDLSFALKWN